MGWENGTEKRKKSVQLTVFLLILFGLSDAQSVQNDDSQGNLPETCKDNEYLNEDRICCDRCPPGYKLKETCKGKGMRSVCERCGDGTYQENMNYFYNCFGCDQCNKDGSFEVSKCQYNKNTVCGCKQGYMRRPNSMFWTCQSCKQCGPGQRKIAGCDGTIDTICGCEPNHYAVDSNTCKNWTAQCETTPMEPVMNPVVIYGGVFAALIAAVGLFFGAKSVLQKRTKESQKDPDPSPLLTKQETAEKTLNYCEIPVIEKDKGVPIPITEDESYSMLSQPPMQQGCIQREIKMHQFLYAVLDVVPVSRFKELMRRLSVSEQDLERAERDNRSFKDSQYQVLKGWIDSSTGGGVIQVPWSCFQDMSNTLRDMCLHGCADSLEEICGSHD